MRNILLIGVDQMRFDVIGPHKSVPSATPHLDELVRTGASFRRAYTTCPLCTPSRASMFTGDYAFTHGMGTNSDMYHALGTELRDPDRLLHKRLLAGGYRCGFVGKWHVGNGLGPGDHGFEGEATTGYGNLTQTDGFRRYLATNDLSYTVKPTLYFNPDQQTMAAGHWQGPVESTPAHYVTSQTIAMVDEFAAGEQPFFLTVQYWDPHGPHLVSDEFYGRTDRSRIAAWPNFRDDLADKPRRVARERDDFYRLHPRTEAEVVEYIGLYCDHMAMLDHEIGRLLQHLRATGADRDTLIIFTSDHGDMTGAHGGLIDKGLLYEEAMRVLLIFHHPSIVAGAREGLALNMDILPTALSMLGIDYEARHGQDLSAQLANPAAPGRKALLAEFHGLRFLYSQRMLVSDDGWKFIFTPGDDDELYDLNGDPGEMNNRVRDPAVSTVLARMRAAMVAETAAAGDPLADCVAKFNGQWRTGSGQFDATTAYLSPSP